MTNFRILRQPLLALLALLLMGAPNTVAAQQQDSDPVPANAAAVNATPVIRNVTILVRNIFEGEDLESFYDFVNDIKIATKQSIIKQELLFAAGEPFDKFLLEESERRLRTLGYVHKVAITPSFDGDFVDIQVSVQDTWTLLPFINLSSGDGTGTNVGVGIIESNLLGYGKRVEVAYKQNDDRDEYQAVWNDPRVAGTRAELTTGYFDRSDGYRYLGRLRSPFRSLVDKKAWAIQADISDTIESLYEGGDERFVFREEQVDLSASYTIARGNPEQRVHRYSFGYDFLEQRFFEADADDYDKIDVDPSTVSMDPALLATDRRFSAPFLSYQSIEPKFVSLNYIDRFERVEDFSLGKNYFAKISYAPSDLGSINDSLLFAVNHSRGWKFGPRSFFRGEIGGSSRYSSSELKNSVIRAEIKYLNNLGLVKPYGLSLGNHTIATSLALDYGDNLDKDNEFDLGADNGLRGYEANTFAGDKRALLNIEDRFHLIDDVYRLISVGGAVFLDAGGSTRESVGELFADDFYADVGFSLRLNFPRSTSARVLRLDFAFPLRDGIDGSDRFELRFIVSGGQAFSSRLKSERLGSETANVDFGL